MPTYEYLCQACDHEFELFQQMSDPVKKKCPECSKLKLKRLIGTGSAVIFKGGGFYETDYRSESYKKGADAAKKAKEKKADSTKEKSASSGNSKSSDGKSAAKKNSAGTGKSPAQSGD